MNFDNLKALESMSKQP